MATALGGEPNPTADALEVDPPRASADEKVSARFTSSLRSPAGRGLLRSRGYGCLLVASPPACAWICIRAADLLVAAFSVPWTRSWFSSNCDICAAASHDLGCSLAAASLQWLAPSFFCAHLDVDGFSLETVRAAVALLSGEGTCCSMFSPLRPTLRARHASVPTLVLLWIVPKAGRNVFYKATVSVTWF